MNLHQSVVPAANTEEAQAALLVRYQTVRAATEELAASLSPEDQNLQPMADASPVKWHRAHTSWFFETFVLKTVRGYVEFDPHYAYLFNSYYGAVGPRHARPERGLLSRPSVEEVGEYRRHVDDAMVALLSQPLDAELLTVIELGLNHEEQHQELILTDLLYAFSRNPLRPAYGPMKSAEAVRKASGEWLTFDGGIVEIGHTGDGFAFDNEGPRHSAILIPYRLSNVLVTNGEWMEFIEAGGYREEKHWLSDGWQYGQANDWQAPLYWEKREGQWWSMTLSGMQPLDPHAPVAHVSFYEADAFARFRGKRLPTEFEWEHAAASLDPATGNFRESGLLRPASSPDTQMFGDVWEWTASAYAPYPGYRAPDGAIGEYNGKFMINQMVLRGGSCVTPRVHVRATYRNFFYPHQRWQFSGLRLAEDMPRHARKHDTNDEASQFLKDVQHGLSQPQKQLGSKYFYDGRGSALFDEICKLPEYYLTRAEVSLLRDLAPELSAMVEPGTVLVEFGCGSCLKTRILLNRMTQLAAYVPIDICGYSLARTAADLARDYPDLAIRPVTADFMETVALPDDLAGRSLLGFFPGSTIGNLTDEEAAGFLKRARETLGPRGRLVIGLDLIKDTETLLAAYNDAAGVTAEFNRNMLARINRELGADFDVSCFSHRAIWNAQQHRIEMHLVSDRQQIVTIGGRSFSFADGETIHTENCHKYDVDSFAAAAAKSGWSLQRVWRSGQPEFGILLLA